MKDRKEEPQKVVIGPNFLAHWFIYDFEICSDYDELKAVMENINYHGYDLITVTQDGRGFYTVFFRRRACG